MPDIFNTLRKQVLRDLGITEDDVKNIKRSSALADRIESGGSLTDNIDTSENITNTDDLSSGYNYLESPIIAEDFGSSFGRFDVMDTFLRFIVSQVVFGLRAMPIYDSDGVSTYQVKIRETGNHPIIFNGTPFLYMGGTIDFTTYIPADGDPSIFVLLCLDSTIADIDTNQTAANSALVVFTDTDFDISDVKLWPKDKIPLALIQLNAADFGKQIDFEEIEDVRPFIQWGNDIQFEEKLWFTETVNGLRDYYFDVGNFPAQPYNKNLQVFRNGVELTYGTTSTQDYELLYNSGTNRYYIRLNFDVATGERLKAFYVKG